MRVTELDVVLHAVNASSRVGVDLETTGLHPLTDRIRLMQLATLAGVFVIDLFAMSHPVCQPLFDLLGRRELIFHNGLFDLQFLAGVGFTPGVVHDTMLLSQLLRGVENLQKGYHKLEQVVERELKLLLDKTEQVSDWSGELRNEQLRYAGLDAAVLPVLFQRFHEEIHRTGQDAVYQIERRCLPAVAWLSRSGVLVDVPAVQALTEKAEQEMAEVTHQLKEQAPIRPLEDKDLWNWNSHPQVMQAFASIGVPLRDAKKATIAALDHPVAKLLSCYRSFRRIKNDTEAAACEAQLHASVPPRPGAGEWNWESPTQILQAFALVHVRLEDSTKQTLAACDHPLARLLTQRRHLSKRVSTYGHSWIEAVARDSRMYAGWRQIGADSGRFSCRSVNLQQLPRDKAYRRCLLAPAGRVLVKADYSQIELRIAAKISGDPVMREAYERGEDLHITTARAVLNVSEVTAEQRQLAKSLNFGLIFGMGAEGFQAYARNNYKVEMTRDQAVAYRNAFFQTYRGLAAWHRRVRRQHVRETRTLTARRRVLDEDVSDTLRLNSPVQGTGADGLKRALALLWERRHLCPGAFPVLVVHDEIVVECDASQVEAVLAWLRQAMIDGMAPLIHPVPVEVEIKYGVNWSCDPLPVAPLVEVSASAVVADVSVEVVVAASPKL
jgi:DNA polymerase I-like protein with 3'-5' exonuclease and polymerase domains